MKHGGVAVLLGVFAVTAGTGCTVVVPGIPSASAEEPTFPVSAPHATAPESELASSRAPGMSSPVRSTVDAENYLTAPGVYHFTSASGKFACMISTEEPTLAGCHGPMPATAPKVPGSGAPDVLVPPNSVSVTADGPAAFTSVGDTRFHGPGAGVQPLPYGHRLDAAGFTCTVDPVTGVTCAARLHGFTVSDSAFDLW
ncbi:hypothetical protein M1M07_08665 [Rhodococcus sp. HM1]|uniref:hypothetical protein n=1 Tax=unclassified Rhodococcus (in: high G+C Gram-positive bacteria) TaxID=192944 RepID=UPI001E52FB52|nr:MULTISPECIES: hypothetical protein [unclassified Rhodococcus (in: high G+C Gram-positive bacteria)]MCK8671190.1 hypothetical protein [Rhodococcus sp. HM1]